MTPEAAVKAKIKAILKEYGAWYCMPMGTGFGKSGVPDFIICHNGRFLAVEAKAGKGKTTALQDRELTRIMEAGGEALVVSDDPVTQEQLRLILERI